MPTFWGSRLLVGAIAVALLALPRLLALSSDAYTRLDWSAGLLTDEGFYTHNARNLALFGYARTDDFNNMLVSPVLHAAQVLVFHSAGFGLVQARAISVVCSLLLLLLLYDALRLHCGRRVAATAVLFLGLDHTSLLYHRMALMDTPASLFAVAALWAFSRGRLAADERTAAKWLLACGACIGVCVTVRSLAFYTVPALLLSALPPQGVTRLQGWRPFATAAAGLGIVFLIYVATWYLPHRHEIDAMNRYYRVQQLQPRSVHHLGMTLYHALLGDHRGISPYLFRHAPVLFGLVLLLLSGTVAGARISWKDAERDVLRFLAWWAGLGAAFLSVIAYSPSRYYVTLYPALYTLAAVTVWRLPAIWEALAATGVFARMARGGLAWFLVYHAVQSVVHRGGVLPQAPTLSLLYGVPTLVALAVALPRLPHQLPPWAFAATLGLWLTTNGLWLTDWVRNMDYSQIRLSRHLAERLPPGSVMLGDVAPGLAWANTHRAINVIPGLCNDERPVERFAGSPRFIVILDGRWKERWWTENYPNLVHPRRRILIARTMRWAVGVYAVDYPGAIPP